MDWDEFKKEIFKLNDRQHIWNEGSPSDKDKFAKDYGDTCTEYIISAENKFEEERRRQQISIIGRHAWQVAMASKENLEKSFMEAQAIDVKIITSEMERRKVEQEEQARLRGEVVPRKAKLQKTKIEKLENRLEAGDLLTEKGLAFSLLHSALDLKAEKLKMSCKAWWIGDCIVRAIVDEYSKPFKVFFSTRVLSDSSATSIFSSSFSSRSSLTSFEEASLIVSPLSCRFPDSKKDLLHL